MMSKIPLIALPLAAAGADATCSFFRCGRKTKSIEATEVGLEMAHVPKAGSSELPSATQENFLPDEPLGINYGGFRLIEYMKEDKNCKGIYNVAIAGPDPFEHPDDAWLWHPEAVFMEQTMPRGLNEEHSRMWYEPEAKEKRKKLKDKVRAELKPILLDALW